jgi:tripartite-type tricarboxylate transporter receptor subunit TctC
MRHMRSGFALATLIVVFAIATGAASAQPYPNRPIRIFVPFAAGGAVDALGRLVGAKLSDNLGQPVLVENRAGAGGNLAPDVVAKSPPDGYTLLLTTNGLAISPALYRALPFDVLKDLAPVTQLLNSSLVLVASPKSQITSVQQLIAQAKARPGALNYGSTGIGNPLHLTVEMIKSAADIELQPVPYRGDAPLMTALIAGEIEIAVVPMATGRPHIEAGRLRALAITGRRSPVLPEVATLMEQGVPVDSSSWQGFFVPAATPRDVVLKIYEETRKAIETPDVRERIKSFGADPVASTPDEFAAHFKADIAKFAKIVEDAKIPKLD